MIVAFLLSVFVDRVSSTSIASPSFQLSFAPDDGPLLTGGKPDHGGHGKDPISEWSSTVGIVTAIIGNVLISLALNIQRHAHVRIEREYESNILRLRAEWKRSSPGLDRRTSTHNNGVVDGDTSGDPVGINATAYTDNPEGGNAFGRANGQVEDDRLEGNGNRNAADSGEEEGDHHLQSSFISDRSTTSFDRSISGVDRKSYLRSPYWWCGIVLMTAGEAGNFLAYGFAPASIVSPLGVVALVSNCMIAPFLLKERFRQRDLLGVLIAVAGAVVVVLSAKTSEHKIGPDDIWGMITRWEFETYLGITIILIIGLMLISRKYGRKTILIDVGLVGLYGGYTALSTKGVSSLLSYTLWHAITFPITYVLVAVLVSSAIMQIRYINRALQHFDSTQVIPTQFVLFTLSVIMGSAILYRDFESATVERVLKFVGGCALTFFAVYLITSGRVRKEEESESESDEEEAIGLHGEEPYRDHVDWEEDGAPIPSRQNTDATGRTKPSPSHSLQSLEEMPYESEEEDGQRTPRAQISTSPGSLLNPSPHPVPTNPWATPTHEREEPDYDIQTAGQLTLGQHNNAEVYPPPTNIILQFPSAPDATDSTPKRDPQTPHDSPRRRSPTRAEMHSSRRLSATRSSFSRFSPGPLLAPLSGGLSAVVADSLRRGEGSPQQHRRSIRGSIKHKSRNKSRPGIPLYSDPTLDPSSIAETQDEVARTLSYHGEGPRISRSTSTTTPEEPQSEGRRNRSLSDSWGGGLFSFGGHLRLGSRRSKDKAPAANNSEDASA